MATCHFCRTLAPFFLGTRIPVSDDTLNAADGLLAPQQIFHCANPAYPEQVEVDKYTKLTQKPVFI